MHFRVIQAYYYTTIHFGEAMKKVKVYFEEIK